MSGVLFMILLVILLGGLGIYDMYTGLTDKKSSVVGQQYFGLLYIIGAVSLLLYSASTKTAP